LRVLVIFYANFWSEFWRILVKWPKKVGFCPLLKMFLASEKPRFYAGLRGVVAKNPLFSLINCEKKIYIFIINRENFWAFGQMVKMRWLKPLTQGLC
jgi:hypothetical protein